MRTLLESAGERVCARVGEGGTEVCGETDAEGDSSAVVEGLGVGDSWAAAIWTRATEATRARIRNLSIVPPVYFWENVVAPFAVAQKCFIDIVCDALIV